MEQQRASSVTCASICTDALDYLIQADQSFNIRWNSSLLSSTQTDLIHLHVYALNGSYNTNSMSSSANSNTLFTPPGSSVTSSMTSSTLSAYSVMRSNKLMCSSFLSSSLTSELIHIYDYVMLNSGQTSVQVPISNQLVRLQQYQQQSTADGDHRLNVNGIPLTILLQGPPSFRTCISGPDSNRRYGLRLAPLPTALLSANSVHSVNPDSSSQDGSHPQRNENNQNHDNNQNPSTIPKNGGNSNSNPSSNNTLYLTIIIPCLFIVMLLAGLFVFYKRKRINTKFLSGNPARSHGSIRSPCDGKDHESMHFETYTINQKDQSISHSPIFSTPFSSPQLPPPLCKGPFSSFKPSFVKKFPNEKSDSRNSAITRDAAELIAETYRNTLSQPEDETNLRSAFSTIVVHCENEPSSRINLNTPNSQQDVNVSEQDILYLKRSQKQRKLKKTFSFKHRTQGLFTPLQNLRLNNSLSKFPGSKLSSESHRRRHSLEMTTLLADENPHSMVIENETSHEPDCFYYPIDTNAPSTSLFPSPRPKQDADSSFNSSVFGDPGIPTLQSFTENNTLHSNRGMISPQKDNQHSSSAMDENSIYSFNSYGRRRQQKYHETFHPALSHETIAAPSLPLSSSFPSSCSPPVLVQHSLKSELNITKTVLLKEPCTAQVYCSVIEEQSHSNFTFNT